MVKKTLLLSEEAARKLEETAERCGASQGRVVELVLLACADEIVPARVERGGPPIVAGRKPPESKRRKRGRSRSS